MSFPRFDQIVELLVSTEFIVGLLWTGLAIFTITLIVLMLTRWGQSRALTKCLVLSLLAHLLLAGYATTVRIVAGSVPERESEVAVSFTDIDQQQPDGDRSAAQAVKPWERFAEEKVAQPETTDPQREELRDMPDPERDPTAEAPNLPGDPSLENLAMAEASQPEPTPPQVEGATGVTTAGKEAEAIRAPKAQRRERPRLDVPDQPELDRRLVRVPGPVPQQRRSEAGSPQTLIDQPTPLPQLREEATTEDPADAVAALTDRLGAMPELRSTAADNAYLNDIPSPMADQPGADTPAEGDPRRGGQDTPGEQATGQGDRPPTELARVEAAAPPEKLPEMYKLRVAPDRREKAEQQGASAATESAVQAALKWLATHQANDGRWRAAQFGAGREENVHGRDRYSAGSRADTGVTGLALLAMLGAGYTQHDGQYQENVQRGIDFLLTTQSRDGNLDGPATTYAKMYCHAMAAFALSEAYGMTADKRLREPVRRAIQYTVDQQNPSTGGWRYIAGDPGDTSQLGWQLMALKSAELAGIPTPKSTRNGMIRFLQSVSGGEHGGLSRYRPGEQITRPMTAEALACWQFLGMPRAHPAGNEAGDFLLREPPGAGEANFYYWYYGTLSMYQLGGTYWDRWNDALQQALLARQVNEGPDAGSWDPNTVWGGHGGRVYTTALGALCLEVYYRFLPLYLEAGAELSDQSEPPR